MKKKTRTQVSSLATAMTLIALGVLAEFIGVADARETLIYKSIAEDGSTVFTDQPAPDATVITPAPLNVMDSPVAQPAGANSTVSATPLPALEKPLTATIDSVVIKYPLDDQTFIDPEAQILVEFSTTPASTLPTGMSANVRLDGVLVVTGSSYQMPIEVPERGTHQLQVQLVDQAGSTIAESQVIHIHIKQHVAGNAN